ncbi:MAG: hypothetical protein R3B09_07885 [Nannocystaceae bacterium]
MEASDEPSIIAALERIFADGRVTEEELIRIWSHIDQSGDGVARDGEVERFAGLVAQTTQARGLQLSAGDLEFSWLWEDRDGDHGRFTLSELRRAMNHLLQLAARPPAAEEEAPPPLDDDEIVAALGQIFADGVVTLREVESIWSSLDPGLDDRLEEAGLARFTALVARTAESQALGLTEGDLSFAWLWEDRDGDPQRFTLDEMRRALQHLVDKARAR